MDIHIRDMTVLQYNDNQRFQAPRLSSQWDKITSQPYKRSISQSNEREFIQEAQPQVIKVVVKLKCLQKDGNASS